MAKLTTYVTVAGNLTRDVEVRYTQAGQPVASFSVASTPSSYDKDKKEFVDGEAVFTNVTLWGKPAENLAASAGKGSRVLVAGALKSRTYQDKEGNSRTATELVADEVGVSVAFTSYTKEGAALRGSAPDAGAAPSQGDDTPW